MTTAELDYPARVRIVFDDDSGNDQRGLIWGFRSRHYSAASTARTAYEAEALQPLGNAVGTATTGASNGTAVRQSPLFAAWTPVLGTNFGGTGFLTHTGTNRVYARCRVAGTAESQVRLSWDVGDLVNATTNDPFTLPNPGTDTTAGTASYIADLGEVRLDPSPVGTHRWQGQIEAQAYDTSGTVDFRIDCLVIVNQDEGAGVLTAPLTTVTQSSTLVAFDDFSQGGTVLAAEAAPLGGNWDPGAAGSSTAEDGDGDDFFFFGDQVLRNPSSADSSLTNGRYEVLDGSSTIAGAEIQADVGAATGSNDREGGSRRCARSFRGHRQLADGGSSLCCFSQRRLRGGHIHQPD